MITPESIASALAANGAVLEVWNSPAQHYLVGELQWLAPNQVFWFVAHGDREDDGRLLEFDRAELEGSQGLRFYRGGKLVGRLTDIPSAEVEDPEDYTVAFSLWQQVAPRAQGLIQRSRSRFGVPG